MSRKNPTTCPVDGGTAVVRKRKFNAKVASRIMAGRLRGSIRTIDGRPVRILAWDARGMRPIVGLIYMGDIDAELSWQWTMSGRTDLRPNVTSPSDLVIELQAMSSMARCHRAHNNKKRK